MRPIRHDQDALPFGCVPASRPGEPPGIRAVTVAAITRTVPIAPIGCVLPSGRDRECLRLGTASQHPVASATA